MARISWFNRGKIGSGPWIIASLWLGTTIVGALLHPSAAHHGTHRELGLPPCTCVLLFDRPCPACGLTTSFTATIHGDLPAAFAAHPFGPILYLSFTALAILAMIAIVKKDADRFDRASGSKFAMVLALVFLAFGVARFATTPHYGTPGERLLSASLGLRK